MAAAGRESALALNGNTARFLPSVQIGITVVAILSGAYGELTLSPQLAALLAGVPLIGAHAKTAASALVVAGIAYVTLVIGELVPKQFALSNRERIACLVAPAMDLLAPITKPVAVLLHLSTAGVLRLARPALTEEPDVTEEEVKTMIAEGTEAGVFEKAEQEIIERLLRVADRSVRSIMQPRPDIVWLDITESAERIYEDIARAGTPASRWAAATWMKRSASCMRRRCSISCTPRAKSISKPRSRRRFMCMKAPTC